MPYRCTLLALLLSSTAFATSMPSLSGPPATPIKPVVEDYFGTKITDPYRWLEDMKSAEFRDWLKAQANYADSMLATIPGRAALRQRLTALADAGASVGGIEQAAGRRFYLKTEPGKDGRRLYMHDGKGERLLLDPDTLGSAAAHVAIDWYSPSPDGRLVAVGVSAGGSEDSELRLLELASGKWLPERIDGAGLNSELGWLHDGSGFFYNRLPPADAKGERERYNKSATYLHKLGTPVASDTGLLGYGLDPARPFDIADIVHLDTVPGSHFVLAEVLHGDAVEHSYYIAPLAKLNGSATPWQRIVTPADKVAGAWLHGDTLYLRSNLDAPRGKLLALDLHHPELAKAKTVLAESPAVLREVAVARDALYIRASEGGVDKLIKLVHGGKAREMALPVQGTIRDLSTDPTRPGALLRLESWVASPRVLALNGKGKLADTGLIKPLAVDFKDYAAKRVMVKSHDGVEVPLSLIAAKAIKRDGSHPTILSGYGAYGITMEARFSATRLAWLEQDGVIAVCHVRGGGEFGEAWHRAGYIQTKANTAKDFIACADYLVKEGYTSPARLAGTGGSAGGITIGGAITARPELFAAAQSAVGISDMLRMELTPNGPPNIAEFGTVTREADFRAMLPNSPYHRIKDGVAYPAVIVTTGANDPRVDAWMPAKLAARLQAASNSHKPVILRVDYDGGHGMGSTKSQQVAESADVWSFFLWRMGVAAYQPK
ncbi:S9 family peptidase [Chitinimonas arctica]|uniref:prolyl oligopeptidase n=1 Tax=Chitinimonas arctica TaxID=2594795 RepID=A0A516SF94_9NEIS|nr:prolyl oligopeptidase family serine peptidase [Chitinimonas arctica]QDQ26837.1 S9 family peptidase [Chitinimonas arctica]